MNMSNEAMDQKCPGCGAPLKYSACSKDWTCEYCGSHFTIEVLKRIRGKREKTSKHITSDGYTCKNCGAQILLSENTTATSCVYCKSSAIIKNRLEKELAPRSIIPFKKTKEEAIEAFTKVGIRKIFIPKEFTNKKNIGEIQGIYIPFFLYDFSLSAKMNGEGTMHTYWRKGDYNYTKTDIYSFRRNGTFPFYDIPVDGSKHFDDALMNSIEPFDYKELVEFDEAYLSGFLAEKYDQPKEELEKIVIDRASQTVENEVSKTLVRYDLKTISEKEITVSGLENEYVLFPVWLLNIKYKGKIYPYAMNGQTGKMIGDIPLKKSKVVFFFLGLSLLISLIVIGIMLLTGGYVL